MGLPEYVLYDIFSVFILLFRSFLRVFFAPFSLSSFGAPHVRSLAYYTLQTLEFCAY